MSKSFRRVVHGTPITSKGNKTIETLRGGSFCVSFAAPEQLDKAIELVGEDGILVLDNGAWSHYQRYLKNGRTGSSAIDRDAFWEWANDAQARCPQAVAVIPDVIEGGTEEANLQEISIAIRHEYAAFPERCMSIWHTGDSIDYLVRQLRLLNFVGIGSSGEYDARKKKAAYLARLREVYKVRETVKAVHGRCPWVHLMRGLGAFSEVAWAESADSCNVAVNCVRFKAEHGDNRAKFLADRISTPIQAAAAELREDSSPASNFDVEEEPADELAIAA